MFKNLKSLDPVKNERDIVRNRKFFNMIKTNISTLVCYNLNLNLDETGNSSFLIGIEEKVPHATFIKWEEQKAKLKGKGENITTDKFLSFYEDRIAREETAPFVGQKSTQEENKTNIYVLNKQIKVKNDRSFESQKAAEVNYVTKNKSATKYQKGNHSPKTNQMAKQRLG